MDESRAAAQIRGNSYKSMRKHKLERRYCTFVPPFFIDDSGAEFHAD